MKTYFVLHGGLIHLLACLLLPVLAVSQVLTPHYISTGPNSNGYYEYLPAGYSTGKSSYPLMIFVQGMGTLGNGVSELPLLLKEAVPQLINTGQFPDSFNVKGEYHSFIIISPQFVKWPSDNDVGDVMAYALKHYRVDTGRVYLTGLSMGGSATWSYAASYQSANMLAAIVPISGGELWKGEAGALNMAHADLAIYAMSNLNDPIVASSTTVHNIALIDSVVPAIQPKALDTIYNAYGHDAWTKTYNPSTILYQGLNIYQWMLLYTRDSTDMPQPATYPAPAPDTIVWASFTATWPPGQTSVNLRWTPSLEANEPYFLVQRSANGKTFTTLDTLPATAYLGNEFTDSAIDSKPLADSDYYRIAAVFMDGKVSYSVIRKVTSAPPVQTPRDTVAWSSVTGTWPTGQSEVALRWATTSESNDRYFLVQRSADRQTYKTFDTVAAVADTNGHSYTALDPSPYPDSDYYRLVAVFLDGKTSSSAVLKLVSMPPVQVAADTVGWADFTASWSAGQTEVTLSWTTTVEQNNHYFFVQRSADGRTFSTLDTMAASANTTGSHTYSALDPKPLPDSGYYRIAAVFMDGKISYSSIGKVVSVPPVDTVPVVPVQTSPDSVAFTSFTAQALVGPPAVGLNWATSFEMNDQYFFVQRSADGQTFDNLDTLTATADSVTGYSYSAVDPNPLTGADYYRLAVTYRDGTIGFSGTRKVVFQQGRDSFFISPNPAFGSLNLWLRNNVTGNLNVRLLDMQGRTLRIWAFVKQDELWLQSIDIGQLSTGSYIIQVIGDSIWIARPFISR